jgi:hypothetical protein
MTIAFMSIASHAAAAGITLSLTERLETSAEKAITQD